MNLIKTICQGALGAITFGAYYQYMTNKIMELNNEKIIMQQKQFMDKIENQHKKEIIEIINQQKLLNIRLEKLEKFVSQH